MKMLTKIVSTAVLGMASLAVMASVFVPKGTHVTLAFDDAVSSKTAHVGDKIRLHVANDVIVNNVTVLHAGTPVKGLISGVRKHTHFGVNASMHITLEPINGIPLVPRTEEKLSGSRADHAAEVSGAGALVLGPVGLLGGYFIVGKPVEIKQGDTIETETSKGVWAK